MLENRYKLNYDIKSKSVNNIAFKKGDIDSSVIQMNLINDSSPVDITGEAIEFRFRKADGTIVYQDITTGVTVTDALNGKVECVLMANTLAYAGEVKCEIYRSKYGKSLTTQTFTFAVEDSIGGEGVISSNYISSIESLLFDINVDENMRISNENTRKSNETVRLGSEVARVGSENTRISNENIRLSNESTRVTNENTRKTNDTTRLASEVTRVSNEITRVSTEDTRKAKETERLASEISRVSNETTRNSVEDIRKTSETDRVSKESIRGANEATRVANENNRITLYNTVQNKLDNGDFKGDTGVVTGEIKLFAGNVVPSLWHLCDGTILNKSEYPVLHQTIGFKYGGNGTTTFALPDLRNRFAIGSSTELAVGTTHNNSTNITLTEDNIPAHIHDINNVVTNNSNTVIPLSLDVKIPVNNDAYDLAKVTNTPSNICTFGVGKAGASLTNIYTTTPPTTGANLKPFTVQKDIAIPNQIIDVASTLTSTGLGTAIDIAPAYLCLNYIIAL